MSFIEDDVEKAAIEWLEELGWTYVHGPLLAPDGDAPERATYATVILEGRFRAALRRINDHLPANAIEEVAGKVLRLDSPSLHENNNAFCSMVRSGIEVMVKLFDNKLALEIDDMDPPMNPDTLAAVSGVGVGTSTALAGQALAAAMVAAETTALVAAAPYVAGGAARKPRPRPRRRPPPRQAAARTAVPRAFRPPRRAAPRAADGASSSAGSDSPRSRPRSAPPRRPATW